jgi:type II secretory pathway pseudopilin PulG
MRRRNSGFSILELMIALAIVMLVLAAATTFFIGTVRQYKIQTKIVETNIEGVLGLELLRQDLESLGFGVPWDNVPGTVTQDISTAPLFNAFSGGPMAVVSLDNPTSGTVTVNASDYLVIRSTRVGTGSAAGKWTTLQPGGGTRSWGSTEEDLGPNDRVVVLSPTLNHRTLVTPGTGILFSAVAGYAPADNLTVTNIVYGVHTANLSFPWNRADYYIDNASLTVPQRCAPNTGVLVKRVVSQAGTGTLTASLPLLDCAADMEVIYGLDTDGNPSTALVWSDDISGLAADAIRTQMKEVRVDILAQEGQRDDSYRTPSDNIHVGSLVLWRDFDVSGYRNYRWKVYTIVVKPRNLGN